MNSHMNMNNGPNINHNIGPNMNQNIGPNMNHNMGPNMNQNMGPNMNQNMGPNLNHNMGNNINPNIGPNMGPNIGPNMGVNMAPNINNKMGGNLNQNTDLQAQSQQNVPYNAQEQMLNMQREDFERSERSVFVGNIPYEATDEQLKNIFQTAGEVRSFRLVTDRETGKPKGYGFAEYNDKQTAMSAMRNLNGKEIFGRSLRVDHATSERNKNQFNDDGTLKIIAPPPDSEYGEACDPSIAPEVINKVVSNLPPDQMYQLMHQMKCCIEKNPEDAKTMLLQNPQLGYAFLQCQVIMKLIAPNTALSLLYPHSNFVTQSESVPEVNKVKQVETSIASSMPKFSQPTVAEPKKLKQDSSSSENIEVEPQMGGFGSFDAPSPPSKSFNSPNKSNFSKSGSPNNFSKQDPFHSQQPQSSRMRDPRKRISNDQPPSFIQEKRNSNSNAYSGSASPGGNDFEKRKLIMQVLKLTPEQIEKLPEDQRKNISILKKGLQNNM